MRVLLTVAANKFTGAAAVAEHWCRALRIAGADAVLAYVGGNNLERRLDGEPWAYPAFVKERSPLGLLGNVRRLRALASDADVVIPHLPHDHLLVRLAGCDRRAAVVRAFRNARHLKAHAYHRWLLRRTRAAVIANSSLAAPLAELAPHLPATVVPVPVEDRFHTRDDGERWRSELGIPVAAPVLGMVGKVARGRGFDLVLRAAATIAAGPWVLFVGHGEARPELEALAAELGIAERVRWAGYHEDELPALFTAMDVVVFPRTGSDHGHRAVSEAQACARPVVSTPVAGIGDLIEDGVDGVVCGDDSTAVANAVAALLGDRRRAAAIAEAAAAAAAQRRFGPVGATLRELLGNAVCAV